MSTNFNQLFYLKKGRANEGQKTPIYLRLTVNGKRSELSISRKVDPKLWDAKLQKVRGNSIEAKQANIFLDKVRNKVNKIHENYLDQHIPFTSADLKNTYLGKDKKVKMLLEIFDEHNRQMKSLVDIEFSLSTYKRYYTTRNHIQQYLKTDYGKNDIPVRDVNLKFIRGFEYFLKEKKSCNHNSSLKYVNLFKKIVRIAVGNGWISKDPFYNYKIKFKSVEREFLSKEELETLVDKELGGKRLSIVKDMFVFCCYTGLSYIDIQELTSDNIVMAIEGNFRIQSKRHKTKTKLGIPLLPPALLLLEKYKEHPKVVNGNCVLPVLSNQKSNAYLKEIAEICRIEKNLTTHLARHTFATTVTLSNGMPIETVSKLLGHKNIRTTQHYAKIMDRKVDEDMKLLQEKMAADRIKEDKLNRKKL